MTGAFGVVDSRLLAEIHEFFDHAFILLRMLRSHRQAMSEIKSARQRARKATEERDKLKEKLKKAQARLAAEKERLRTSLEKLES